MEISAVTLKLISLYE